MSRVETPTYLIAGSGDHDSMFVQKVKLLIVSGPEQGQEFVVNKDAFGMGTGPHNDLILQDTTISHQHSEIQLSPEGFIIRDLGSTNGTIVQGVRVTEAFLEEGTEFQMGKTRIVFCPLHETVEYALSRNESFGQLLGKSVAMRRVFHTAETYSPTDATILIEGETGTGKEVLAEEIHKHSLRKDKPFIVIDCAALAGELIESELFGHTKGAFTGANVDRVGAFEHAHGGTIFLDEIGDLTADLQPKLLRVLEKKQIRRVGSNQLKKIDVRIISATNKQLRNEVNGDRFREDLYYRLSVVRMTLPPLRRRTEDIPMLATKFLRQFHGEDAMDQLDDFDNAVLSLNRHDWPGNVRELRNLVEMASYTEKRPIDLAAFLYLGKMRSRNEAKVMNFKANKPFKDAKNELISQFEKSYIRDLLAKNGGNVSQASREAEIERAYLQRLIKKYEIR